MSYRSEIKKVVKKYYPKYKIEEVYTPHAQRTYQDALYITIGIRAKETKKSKPCQE